MDAMVPEHSRVPALERAGDPGTRLMRGAPGDSDHGDIY
jgi:hypothetical protein